MHSGIRKFIEEMEKNSQLKHTAYSKALEPELSKENIVKNQHYIPESLLRNFVNSENKIIEVLLKNKKIYPTDPSNSMSEKFVYEHDALKKNTVEKYFAKIDSEIAPMVKEIIKKIEHLKNGKINIKVIKECIESLLPIFIIFYYRSGALLTEFSSINPKDKIPLLSKKILNYQYVDLLGETIKKCYKFAIIESDGNFLLSDQFLSTSALKIKARFFNISNRHIGLKETLILIPISSSYYIAYWNSGSDFLVEENSLRKLSSNDIKLINSSIMSNSYIKCIGQRQEDINGVLDNYRMEYPSQIYAGGAPSGYYCGAINKKEVFFYEEDSKAFDFLLYGMFNNFDGLGRNDICGCKSGKKFKKCCEDNYNKVKNIVRDFGEPPTSLRSKHGIPEAVIYELPVERWEGIDKSKR